MLVLHGDEFDSVVKCSPWLAKLGSNLYDVLLAANPYINWVRRKFDLPHWSLSSYLKERRRKPFNTSAASRTPSRKRHASAGSTRWYAATFTMPKYGTSTASCTATMEIGSRAALRWSRT